MNEGNNSYVWYNYQKCNQLPFCSVWFRTQIQPGSMCKWCMGFVCRIPNHEYKTTWCTGGSPLQLFDVHIITCTYDYIHTLTLYNDKPRPLSDTTNCFNEGVKMVRCLVAWEDEKMKISTFGCLRFEMVIYSNCFSFPSSSSQESLLGDGDAPKTNVEGSDWLSNKQGLEWHDVSDVASGWMSFSTD